MFGRIATVLVLSGGWAGLASGATFFADARAQVNSGFCDEDSEMQTDSVPVSASAGAGGCGFNAGTGATTDWGSIEGWLLASADGTGSGSGTAVGVARVILEDVVVTKLPGFEGLPDSVDVTIRLDVDYTRNEGDSSEELIIRVGSAVLTQQTFGASAQTVVSHSFTAQVGQPFNIEFEGVLDGRAGGHLTTDGADHSYTAALFESEVVQVPEGYTVNSPVIVDSVLVPPVCAGDIDGDGDTDVFDFGIFAGAFGTSTGDAGYVAGADLDGNGVIDVFDFGMFASDFGCPG